MTPGQYDQHVRDLKGLTSRYWFAVAQCWRDSSDPYCTTEVILLQQILPPVAMNIDTRPWSAYYL